MKRRALCGALSVFLIFGSSMFSACTSKSDRSASANRKGGVFQRGLKPKPSIERHSSGARVNSAILSQSNRSNTRVVIDVADQRGYLLVNGKIAVETPVSTARPGKWTPRGSFSMSERVRSGKISTIYGVLMPYWMRLSGSAYGVHAGHLPGYPASAGCIRLPASAAQVIYDNTSHGTRVNIYSSWSGV
jgi:lipoprotein-anchoring transpeptidase ErfK/SrfK